MFENRKAIKPVEKTIKPKKTIISNYGGLEAIQNIVFFLFLARFYKVWTMQFSVFEHRSNEVIVFLVSHYYKQIISDRIS